jgi:hypothetical protein
MPRRQRSVTASGPATATSFDASAAGLCSRLGLECVGQRTQVGTAGLETGNQHAGSRQHLVVIVAVELEQQLEYRAAARGAGRHSCRAPVATAARNAHPLIGRCLD